MGRFLTQDPLARQIDGYVDGINAYEYVKSCPIMLSDPFGKWSWRNADDIWIIQTILNNNLKKFGLNLGTTGADNNGIDGDYGPLTGASVCKFQKKMKDLGAKLPVFGADGRWGDETTRAFEKLEDEGKVNYRYAHLRVGVFFGAGFVSGIGSWTLPSGTVWAGAHAARESKTNVDIETAVISTSSTNSDGIYAEAGIIVVLAYNVFNEADFDSLGGTSTDWNADIGFLKGKLLNKCKPTISATLSFINTLVSNGPNIKNGIGVIASKASNEIWRGVPNSYTFSATAAAGVSFGSITTTYNSTSFEYGN